MALVVNKLQFSYPASHSFKGLRSLSFQLEESDFLSVFGKSGSGKTTLLKCIYGLEDIQKGEIKFGNEKVFGPAFNLIPGNSNMKLVSQDYYVLDNHSVYENIYDRLSGYTDDYKKKRSEEMMRRLQLTSCRNSIAKFLSSGQKQRLSIARALADFPKVLLLDEPFSNLDLGLRDEIYSYIRFEANKNNSIIILVTHQPEEALKFANKVMVIEQGRMLAFNSPAEIYFQQDNFKVARLLGKAFELAKEDFFKCGKLKFRKGKVILRPEAFLPLEKGWNGIVLKGKIVDNYFAPDKNEILVKLDSGKKISFFTSNHDFQIGKEICLTISDSSNKKITKE